VGSWGGIIEQVLLELGHADHAGVGWSSQSGVKIWKSKPGAGGSGL
jgi:hypothetical protein